MKITILKKKMLNYQRYIVNVREYINSKIIL